MGVAIAICQNCMCHKPTLAAHFTVVKSTKGPI